MQHTHRVERLLRLFPDLPLRVRVSARARLVKLRVLRHGEVELVLPRGTDPMDALEFLRARKAWLVSTLGDLRRRTGRVDAVCNAIPTGLILRAIGERWVVAPEDRSEEGGAASLAAESLLRILVRGEEPASVRARLRGWLLGRASEVLPAWLTRESRRTGIPFVGVRVKDLRSRWGSCSVRGQINLNCKLLFLPPELVDYVLVHELCHIRHMHHGPAFWRLLESHLPGGRERARELRRGGAWVPRWMECDPKSTASARRGVA